MAKKWSQMEEISSLFLYETLKVEEVKVVFSIWSHFGKNDPKWQNKTTLFYGTLKFEE